MKGKKTAQAAMPAGAIALAEGLPRFKTVLLMVRAGVPGAEPGRGRSRRHRHSLCLLVARHREQARGGGIVAVRARRFRPGTAPGPAPGCRAEVDADENHLADPGLVDLPLGAEVAAHELVHALEDHLAPVPFMFSTPFVAQQQDRRPAMAPRKSSSLAGSKAFVGPIDEALDVVVVVMMATMARMAAMLAMRMVVAAVVMTMLVVTVLMVAMAVIVIVMLRAHRRA